MLIVKRATYLTSAPSIEEGIEEGITEVAFLGRSNVGKSSFINSITNYKNLAKSSSTPGKTKMINFFEVVFKKDDNDFICRFVDLPGFGYAKVSKKEKLNWEKNLTKFLKERNSIRLFIHLRDARHINLESDKNLSKYLNSIKREDQKILEIFTKVDKLKQKEKSLLLKKFPNALLISNLKKLHIEKAREVIFNSLFMM